MRRSLIAVAALALATSPAWAQDFSQPLPPPLAPAPHVPVLTRAPTLKTAPAPTYPPAALAADLSADVKLTIDIGADGRVTSAAVPQPVGDGFDEAAVAAARLFEFTPAEIDGQPAAIRIEYVLYFRAPEPVPPPPPEAAPPEALPEPTLPTLPPPRLLARGHIREKGTRSPIVGASVQVIRHAAMPAGPDASAEEVTTSDANGAFEIRADAPTGARLVIADAAHDSCIRDVTPSEAIGSAPIVWDCFARPTSTGFLTNVKATRPTTGVQRFTLSKPELTTVPGTYGDPLRVIQNLPGVSRAPYGLGLLIVRGAPPTDTGVFVGGQAIPQLYHFLVGPSVMAPHLIDHVDFYPGGFGVRYGRASGGAVDVVLKEGPAPELHGGADVGVLDASAYVEGPLREGISATASVRRSTIDAILPHVIPGRSGSTFRTVVPIYWDYQARVTAELPSGGRAGLMAFGSDDSLKVVTQDPAAGDLSLDSHSGFHRVVGFLVTRLGDWTSRFSPAYGNGSDDFTLGVGSGYIRYQRLFLRQDLGGPVGRHLDLRFGFDGLVSYDTAFFNSWFPREGRNFGTGALQLAETSRRIIDWAPAAFIEGDWHPRERIHVVPGLRFDLFHVLHTDKTSLDPRLNVRWEPHAGWIVKAGAGLYHQLPVGQFLDSEFGNPNLALIWSEQYSAGVERQVTPALRLDAVAYFLRRHDLPVPSPERFSSTGRGRGWGLELWLKHELTAHFFGWIAYTLSWSQETAATAEEMLAGTAGGSVARSDARGYHPSAYDQRHNLIVVASYSRWAWQFGARYRLVSGSPTSRITGSFYDTDFGAYTPIEVPAAGRLPTFSQLDLRIERTFTFDVWTLGVYLDVQNIFNAENPENFAYDYRFQEQAPVRGLPILPVVGLRGRF